MVLNTSTSGQTSESDFDYNVGHDINDHIGKSQHFGKLYDGTLRYKFAPSSVVSPQVLKQELKKSEKLKSIKSTNFSERHTKRKLKD